jgi:nitrate/TMAO reductase-like tetraheme cytochrome c subunit
VTFKAISSWINSLIFAVVATSTVVATMITAVSVNAQPLPLIYSGNLDGELEPCGCTEEGNLGGINRRVTLFDKIRAENPQLVAISGGGLISAEGSTDQIKAKYILKGFTELKYDAIGMQWKDLAYGADFVTREPLPWVVSNWEHQGVQAEKTITRSLGEQTVKLKIFSWLDPSYSPMRQMLGDHSLVRDNAESIKTAIAAADAQGFVTVLLTSLPLEAIKDTFDLQAVDIVFIRASYEVFGEPTQDGKTLVLQPGSRGMRIARLDLNIDPKGNIKDWTNKVIGLPSSVADSPRMKSWYTAYNDEVKQDYLKRVELRKQLESGASKYAGEEACKTCHSAEYKKWFDSQHAIAYEELEGVNKAFDPACIGCHTVGFGEPDGFIDMSLTPHLLNVQCENCHGAAKAHVESKGVKPVANHDWPKEKICGQCHVQKHSPSFSIEKYWPKIAH